MKLILLISLLLILTCCHYEISTRQYGLTEPIKVYPKYIIHTDTSSNLVIIMFKEKICD